MKKTKIIKTLIIPVIICASVLFGWKINKAAQNNIEFSICTVEASMENFNGSSEFFFRPIGDTKSWHIINRYVSQNENDTLECNNSDYLFSKDLVQVVNDIVIGEEDVAIAGTGTFRKGANPIFDGR